MDENVPAIFAPDKAILFLVVKPLQTKMQPSTTSPEASRWRNFERSLRELSQPFDIIALLCGSLGLRISECLALRWSDVDWLKNRLKVERGIVRQIVHATKTDGSRKASPRTTLC